MKPFRRKTIEIESKFIVKLGDMGTHFISVDPIAEVALEKVWKSLIKRGVII